MSEATVPQSPSIARAARPRRGIVYTLLVIATITGILASVAVWSARQLLETDQWTQTSTKLLEDDDIRTALGTFLVDSLFDNVDVQTQLASALPPRLSILAGPATGAIRQLAEERAPIFLSRPKVQELWEQINRTAHERFVALIDGDAPAVDEANGTVYLDLGVIVQQLGSELGIGAAAKIPTGVAQLEVMDQSDLDFMRSSVKLLRGAAYILAALSLLLLALAVYLSQGWRRVTIRSCGFVFILIGAVVLLARSIGTGFAVDALANTAATEPAIRSTVGIGTSLLGDLGVAMIGYGIAIVIGAWLAGSGTFGTAARKSITPFIRDRSVLYPILLLIVLAVYVWSPTEGTRRLIPSLLLIILLVAGAEALRRQAREEFPDATLDTFAKRWQDRVESMRARGEARWRGRGSEAPTEVAASASPADDRISQLERLGQLHESGVIDAEELKREKELIT